MTMKLPLSMSIGPAEPRRTVSLKHRPAGSPNCRPHAFTLIELMISMTILAMLLVSIYASWSQIMRSIQSAQKAAAAVQRSRVAVRAVEDALLTAQVYNANPQLYWFSADTRGDFASLDMVAHLPESFPGSGIYGEQKLRHVSFNVEPASEGGNQLVLRQWPLLMPIGQSESAKPYTIVLGRDVDLFTLDFYDLKINDWVKEWEDTNQFPKLVRVAIGMGNRRDTPRDQREIITRIVAPAASIVPVEAQIPGAGSARPPMAMPGMPQPPQPSRPGVPNPSLQPGFAPRPLR
jgi:prepilin-type N-terminal cleavage/methylation domain-containing protein